jgi:hypothetical protein
MTQISRPFQIALAAVVVLFALWFAVLRGHSSGSESSSSAAAPSAQPATAPQASASSGSSSSPAGSSGSPRSTPTTGSTYHGSAPGVAGLTRAIAKARGAVAQSQQNAQRLRQKSEAVSASSGSTQAGSPSKPGSTSAKSAAEAAPSGAGKTHSSAPVAPVKHARAGAGVPAMQVKVEGQLKQGKVVAILLWNPKGSVDAVVRRELQAAGRTFGGKLAVHIALAPQVGSFGTFTRAVQVYSTPTILIINPKGAASSVTGLTDAFSIEQAVREAKQAH